ncbi:hypothetical protein GCM10010407_12620 [Rarobacter incanus]
MPGTTVTGADFMHDLDASGDSELKIGSLFSGYGGLDLAVEHVFNAKTVWFSELNEPVARVFSRHWPVAPNLGDITAIDWSQVEPVDILIGGFPCLKTFPPSASAPASRLARARVCGRTWPRPSTCSSQNGSSSRTSAGCCPHPRHGHPQKETTMNDATQAMQPPTAQPFAAWNPTRGTWETTQLDLYGLSAPFSAIWPTCGWMRDGSAYRLPLSALLTNASASSRSPGALFRTPLATDSSRGGETLDQVRARRGTIALSHQIIDFALHGPSGSPNRRAESETLWSLIDGLFSAGHATPRLSPAGNTSPDAPRQRQPS